VRITRCRQFSDSRFYGCVAAVLDSLSGRLHAATMWLHRKVANRKVSASACELTLDTHRRGTLIVLDRRSTLVDALEPHLGIGRSADVIRRGVIVCMPRKKS
jgi:hypothetical protein